MSNEKFPVSLKAMAESKLNGVTKTTYFQVDPRSIEVQEGFNARPIDHEHVNSIKQAYSAGATLPPLYVRVDAGKIILIDGHHRLAALMLLIDEGQEILRVDCNQFRGSDADRVALMLTSASGKALTPLETGLQYKKLVGFGWSAKEISEKVGKSTTHIDDMLLLANSNTDVRNLVTVKAVAATIAVQTVKQHGDNAGAVLNEQLQSAKAQGKTKVTAKTIKAASPKQQPSREGIISLVMKAYDVQPDIAEKVIFELFERQSA